VLPLTKGGARDTAEAMQPSSPRQRALLFAALVALLAVALPALTVNLEGRVMQSWDEALYAAKARNALANDAWLYAVNGDGSFAADFAKPPLVVWLIGASWSLFGVSMASLRLPFALTTLLLAVVMLLWGRRLRPGERDDAGLGLTWALCLCVGGSAFSWGRTANTDMLLTAFSMMALFAYGRAVDEERLGPSLRWAAASGLLLGLAFLTKQVAVAVAMLPLAILELWRWPRENLARPPLRGAAALIPFFLVAGGWFWLCWQEVDDLVWRNMIERNVSDRVSAFEGLAHFNWLNRSADAAAKMLYPWSWPLGVAGLVGLLVEKARARRDEGGPRLPGGIWLIPLYAVSAVLAYDIVSSSLMDWYIYAIVPALTLGVAWGIRRAVDVFLCLARGEGLADIPAGVLLAGGFGLAIIGDGILNVVHKSASQLAVAAMLAAAASAAGVWAVTRARALPAGPVGAVVTGVVVVAVFSFGFARDQRLTAGTPRFEQLWDNAGAYKKPQAPPRRLRKGGDPNWRRDRPDGFQGAPDAFVELLSWPTELAPTKGVRVRRVKGATAYFGDLKKPPYEIAAMNAILDRGPLTFEAEDLHGGSASEVVSDARAHDGVARRVAPWLDERVKGHALTRGETIDIPGGQYVAVFYVGWDCRGFDHQSVGRISVRGTSSRSQKLDCKEGGNERYIPVERRFRMRDPGRVRIEARYTFGGLSHDRTEIWRTDLWEKHKRAQRAAMPPAPKTAEAGVEESDEGDDEGDDDGDGDDGDESDDKVEGAPENGGELPAVEPPSPAPPPKPARVLPKPPAKPAGPKWGAPAKPDE
jgi:4-amino-4-deoxy-L-arabinose transferase-like glycosyltransferase